MDGERTVGTYTACESRWSISSLAPDADHITRHARGHWATENGLHWDLDVAMRHDHTRIRTDHVPENVAIPHLVALNPSKQERFEKIGIKSGRLLLSWDHDDRLHVVMGAKDQDAIPLTQPPRRSRDGSGDTSRRRSEPAPSGSWSTSTGASPRWLGSSA